MYKAISLLITLSLVTACGSTPENGPLATPDFNSEPMSDVVSETPQDEVKSKVTPVDDPFVSNKDLGRQKAIERFAVISEATENAKKQAKDPKKSPSNILIPDQVAVIGLRKLNSIAESDLSALDNSIYEAIGRLPQAKFSVIKFDDTDKVDSSASPHQCNDLCALKKGARQGAKWVVVGEVAVQTTTQVKLYLYNVDQIDLMANNKEGVDKHEFAEAEVEANLSSVNTLNSMLQAKVLNLFIKEDSNIDTISRHLSEGIQFKKHHYHSIPLLLTHKRSKLSGQPSYPSSIEHHTITLASFENLSLDSLSRCDEALALDEDESVPPQQKIDRWKAVTKLVPEIESIATARIKVWSEYLKKLEEYNKNVNNEFDQDIHSTPIAYQKVQELLEEDEKIKQNKRYQVAKDWKKLSKILNLRILDDQSKQKWVLAFLEAHGAIEKLNPYVKQLASQIDQLRGENLSHLGFLEENSELEIEALKGRQKLIENKIVEITRKLVDGPRGLTFIKIPSGNFMMGSNDGDPDEKPVHPVKVDSFLLTETEVTVAQYRKCVVAGVCSVPDTGRKCTWREPNGDNLPINCVDWGQARTYAVWAGGDLPTEAEWEYAARGNQTTLYAGSNKIEDVAWYSETTKAPKFVRQLSANNYGLYDMSGNVKEWILDKWNQQGYEKAAPLAHDVKIADCTGKCERPKGKRVCRGGGWLSEAKFIRITNREFNSPELRYPVVGFRVKRKIPKIF